VHGDIRRSRGSCLRRDGRWRDINKTAAIFAQPERRYGGARPAQQTEWAKVCSGVKEEHLSIQFPARDFHIQLLAKKDVFAEGEVFTAGGPHQDRVKSRCARQSNKQTIDFQMGAILAL